jgi:hypothetical protein
LTSTTTSPAGAAESLVTGWIASDAAISGIGQVPARIVAATSGKQKLLDNMSSLGKPGRFTAIA